MLTKLNVTRPFAGLMVAVSLVAVPIVAQAHFKLLEPASWIVEDQRLGDPQKAAPCGGTNSDAGTPSNVVNKATGGEKVHIKVTETIYHPGHYRIALSTNGHEGLPADEDVQTKEGPRGPQSVSATIMSPVKAPILVDGLWPHAERPATPATYETDVQLPNITCPKCTLQITQFMAEHGYNNPGGYIYHHCAEYQITADPAKPMDRGWPAARAN
jgi:hypothetical protein